MEEMEYTSPELTEQNVDGIDDPFEFDDLEDDTEVDGTENDSAVPEAEEEFTVKYNGEEQKLNRDQMTEYAQKGMNYDKVKGKLDSYLEGNIARAFKAQADKAGMSPEEFASYVLDNEAADAELAEEQAIRNQYGNVPDALLKELVASRTASKKASAAAKQESAEAEKWGKLLDEYPDVTAENIPQDVREAVANGVDPVTAMHKHRIAELEQKLQTQAVEQQNKINKQKSVGSAQSGHSAADADPFLMGFGY